jgi:hypothetical protein
VENEGIKYSNMTIPVSYQHPNPPQTERKKERERKREKREGTEGSGREEKEEEERKIKKQTHKGIMDWKIIKEVEGGRSERQTPLPFVECVHSHGQPLYKCEPCRWRESLRYYW